VSSSCDCFPPCQGNRNRLSTPLYRYAAKAKDRTATLKEVEGRRGDKKAVEEEMRKFKDEQKKQLDTLLAEYISIRDAMGRSGLFRYLQVPVVLTTTLVMRHRGLHGGFACSTRPVCLRPLTISLSSRILFSSFDFANSARCASFICIVLQN
jgi:hypothetical protein